MNVSASFHPNTPSTSTARFRTSPSLSFTNAFTPLTARRSFKFPNSTNDTHRTVAFPLFNPFMYADSFSSSVNSNPVITSAANLLIFSFLSPLASTNSRTASFAFNSPNFFTALYRTPSSLLPNALLYPSIISPRLTFNLPNTLSAASRTFSDPSPNRSNTSFFPSPISPNAITAAKRTSVYLSTAFAFNSSAAPTALSSFNPLIAPTTTRQSLSFNLAIKVPSSFHPNTLNTSMALFLTSLFESSISFLTSLTARLSFSPSNCHNDPRRTVAFPLFNPSINPLNFSSVLNSNPSITSRTAPRTYSSLSPVASTKPFTASFAFNSPNFFTALYRTPSSLLPNALLYPSIISPRLTFNLPNTLSAASRTFSDPSPNRSNTSFFPSPISPNAITTAKRTSVYLSTAFALINSTALTALILPNSLIALATTPQS